MLCQVTVYVGFVCMWFLPDSPPIFTLVGGLGTVNHPQVCLSGRFLLALIFHAQCVFTGSGLSAMSVCLFFHKWQRCFCCCAPCLCCFCSEQSQGCLTFYTSMCLLFVALVQTQFQFNISYFKMHFCQFLAEQLLYNCPRIPHAVLRIAYISCSLQNVINLRNINFAILSFIMYHY